MNYEMNIKMFTSYYEIPVLLNPNNPNNTYNPHVVIMLKRAYRELYMNDIDNSYFETEPMKFDGMIN